MKAIKKFLSFILISCAAAAALFGCSVSFPSGGSNLPADGMVKKSVFQDAEEHSKMLTFHGKSGGISYSWFFNGDCITAPSDQDLKVDFKEAGDDLHGAVSSSELLKFNFNESHLINAETTLKIDFPKLLRAQKARLYEKKSGQLIRLLEMPLNNDKTSSVTLPVNHTEGFFYIAAMDASFYENASRVTADPDGTSDNGSKPASTSAAAKTQSSNSPAPNAKQNGKQGASGYKSGAGSSKAESPSSGNSKKGRYRTDPTPAGKPKPAEPQDTEKNTKKSYYCTLSIDCKTILGSMDRFSKNKKSVLPSGGIIFKSQKVLFYEGESVFDVLLRETKKNSIQMEYKSTPAYNSDYIEGIHNIYEFDCGDLSGWMYEVNGWYPNYGCSRYVLKNGDVVDWKYTCDLGRDIGGDGNIQQ